MSCFHFTLRRHRLLADLHTPVHVYLNVRDLYTQSVLMESTDAQSRENSRSFIAFDPLASVAVSRGDVTLKFPDGSRRSGRIDADHSLADTLTGFLRAFHVEGDPAEGCGLYGYTSFDAVRYLEPVDVRSVDAGPYDAPDVCYVLFRYVVVFHPFDQSLDLIELLADGEESHLDDVAQAIARPDVALYRFRPVGPTHSPLTDDDHRRNIRRSIEHCLRGDVFQIVVSRRFIQSYEGDDFTLYRALRTVNPSPYLFYFDMGGFRIFGSSPETHCRIQGDVAYIDPIAGTTRRTGRDDEDEAATRALSADPKENAEHVMLVDLARNDLSRHCRHVRVETFKELRRYSHVIHLVSRVAGQLPPGADPVRTFLDTFPAGTLSGAPKVKAMQLISELEPHSRGAYGGCIGFIGLDGDLNQAIIIRSFVSRAGELWLQAGGGITALSDVENELQEVNNKLGALRKAIAVATTL